MAEKTSQRVRDPIHGLITFDLENEVDRLAWALIDTPEFQRLRRIRQLGFSDLVYPGATHSRLSHSIGVFHNARRIIEIIGKLSDLDKHKAKTAVIAALLHDVGHGPFSHAFEKSLSDGKGAKRKHEDWTAEIVSGDTEIRRVLDGDDPKLAEAIANLIRRKDPIDIYDSVVSSQFDADRLDYLRRDRYMTGSGAGGFDSEWLLDCLRIGKVMIGLSPDEDFVEVEQFYLSEKGLQAAEAFLLARHHLYAQVYLHKTTRSAEGMLTALLSRVAQSVRDGDAAKLGLPPTNVLVIFLSEQEPSLDSYIRLDDAAIWATIGELTSSQDPAVSHLASRLRDRRLFKCRDIGALAASHPDDSLLRFKKFLKARCGEMLGMSIVEDTARLTAYTYHDFDDRGAFQKVLIAQPGEMRPSDIATVSKIVDSIGEKKIFRVYAADDASLQMVDTLWQEAKGQ